MRKDQADFLEILKKDKWFENIEIECQIKKTDDESGIIILARVNEKTGIGMIVLDTVDFNNIGNIQMYKELLKHELERNYGKKCKICGQIDFGQTGE